jgi:Protein of unknown function (DUF4238)
MQRTNEHYLPRFLLKGFASGTNGDEVKTWWFRNAMEPKEINIKNIAAEKDFHTTSSGSSADDGMKPLENRFAWYVESLRQERHEGHLDDPVIPELVANLTVRTKAFRVGLTHSTAMAMREVFERLRDTHKLNKIASRLLGDPSGRILNALINNLSPEYADAFVKELSNAIALMHSPLGSALSKWHLERLERAFESDFPKVAKDSHVGALLIAPVPETLIASLAHLQWHLVVRNHGSFILGDVGPIFKIEHSTRAKAAPIGLYEYDAAFLPISDSHLLAGWERRLLSDLDFVEDVNQFSCSCSENFFISARNTAREQNYALQLGSKAELLDKEARAPLVDNILGLLGAFAPDHGER